VPSSGCNTVDSCKNRRFEGCIASIIRVEGIVFLLSVLKLLVTSNFVSSFDSFHSEVGGDKFLRNIGYYKSHEVTLFQKTVFFIAVAVKTSNIIQDRKYPN
jgi:hypothetical protein